MQRIICIVGPTASGKTELVVRVARHLDGEVISCDSVQIFCRFDIGSAKPTPQQQAGIPHYMIDVAQPQEIWSAGRYARAVLTIIQDILARSKMPIVCGGTGLYMAALNGQLDDIPPAQRLSYGSDAYEQLVCVDPDYALILSPNDTKRIHRALDVFHATEKPFSHFHSAGRDRGVETTRKLWMPVYVGICPQNRTERIEKRTHEMFCNGLLEETETLLASGVPSDCQPMESIGYKQSRAVLRNNMTVQEAQEEVVLRTRQYAKRQMTWFRNRTDAVWLTNLGTSQEQENALEPIKKLVKSI